MGQSWSKISKTKVMTDSGPRDVIMFGGGYDGNNHDPVGGEDVGSDSNGLRNEDFLGRTIYIADAETGRLLWNADPADPDFSEMNYAIPSDGHRVVHGVAGSGKTLILAYRAHRPMM